MHRSISESSLTLIRADAQYGEEETDTETPEYGVSKEGLVKPHDRFPLQRRSPLRDHEPGGEQEDAVDDGVNCERLFEAQRGEQNAEYQGRHGTA